MLKSSTKLLSFFTRGMNFGDCFQYIEVIPPSTPLHQSVNSPLTRTVRSIQDQVYRTLIVTNER